MMQTRNKGQSTAGADLLFLNNCPGHPSAEELCTQGCHIGHFKAKLWKFGLSQSPWPYEFFFGPRFIFGLFWLYFRLANCWASVSTLLINKSWKNLLPNFIDSEIEEIQLASLINQLQNTNPMSNTESLQWAAEADDSLARNEILIDDKIIRTVAAEDDDDDDVTPVKISHSEAVAALNTK
ncbi:hypothetical protein AVEN_200640-1 [Araneus ventricosus]|uniref:DDE-1 domain-containing protein n=1 Tax=Araneus ventricosus TaxID=182803 RepID=A0A4Y2I3C4_ARAVE|nr:hypothetical protein AVEN_200640-1 [Araneus ventricosus]